MFERQKDKKFVKWAKTVKDRDGYICQICKAYGVSLNSHHKNSWDTFEDQRYLLENGITLCATCHSTLHAVYGRGKNTVYQLKQFIKSYNIFKEQMMNIDCEALSVESLKADVSELHDEPDSDL